MALCGDAAAEGEHAAAAAAGLGAQPQQQHVQPVVAASLICTNRVSGTASLDDVFSWLAGTLRTPTLPRAQYGKLDPAWEAPKATTSWRRRIPLQGRQGPRRVEPYSLRRTKDGNLVLFVVNEYGQLRSYRVDRIAAIRPTAVQFSPKFRVEF